MDDRLAEQYIENLFAKDEQFEQVRVALQKNDMPDISVAPGYGRLLTLIVRMTQASDVLEIGALGGYSAICLCRGMDANGRLVSLELKEAFAAVAREQVSLAGYSQQVQWMIGEALDSLALLEQEGRRFDFFFIDADKGNYVNYLDYAIRLAKPGAVIVGDNTFMRGKTLNLNQNGPSALAMREFNRRIAHDPRLESAMLPSYDGLAIARVKSRT